MSGSGVLENSERAWLAPEATCAFDRAEVERRIGPCPESLERLGGGQANLNIRVGQSELLRIYRRDPACAAKEARVLSLPWSSFRVPEVRAQGADFLRLEYVPHTPLEACTEHARALGHALGEIHAHTFAQSGELGADLNVRLPFDDFVEALSSYAESSLASSELGSARDLAPAVRRFFDQHRSALCESAGPPVLLHGDFKVSNLHWAEGRLLVLDWEFCYAGSALMDVGQLLRWAPPDEFVAEFAGAYRESGGRLAGDFRAASQRFDLVNLAGLLRSAAAGSQRERDVSERIRRTLAESG
jgi:hypothetical protein